jgi:hypothetical protein
MVEDYLDNININLAGKRRNFHAYIKQNYSDKGRLYRQNLYQVTCKDKIELAFLNLQII